MNKGLKLLFCKECNRKRYCRSIRIPGNNFRKECSKGHTWINKGVTLERISAIIQDTFSSDKLKHLFERDDSFFTKIRR
jgi:hypothetical protein